VISQSKRNIFPVVDDNGKFMGIVLLDEIRDIMFNAELYDSTYVRDFISLPPDFINIKDTMEVVMRKFEETDSWNLPVLDKSNILIIIKKG
jgi:CIC family chloride channel protein